MKKKKVIGSLLLLMVIIGFGCKTDTRKKPSETSFEIKGSNWNDFEGGLVEIYVSDTTVGGGTLKAKAIIKKGEFICSGTIKHPQNAIISVKQGDSYKLKDIIILEPGTLDITYQPNNQRISKIAVSGGKYNEIVRNKVFNDPECLAKEKASYKYSATLNEEDQKDRIKMQKDMALSRAYYDARFKKYKEIRDNHPDPFARLLAIAYSRMGIDTKTESELLDLKAQLGSVPELEELLYNLRSSRMRAQNFKKVTLGTTIKDFAAKDLIGTEFHLADVLKKNKYVLVEFWASWCSPCRAEIPYMKKTYEKYKNRGFEIVSFTLDHEKHRWEKASQEEDIPWINVGDMLAYKSPVVKMYGIGGVPMNYLVNSDGTIVATNLRQEKLDQKLEELLEK